jgi:hypothetical protein
MDRTLTLSATVRLAVIIGWAQRNTRLRWLDERGDIATGTARSIGDERGNFLTATDDVRDGFLRITTSAGWEWFVPIAEVLARVEQETIAEA